MSAPSGAILADSAILAAVEAGDIVVEPFDRDCLGSNSYDVHLGSTLAVYELPVNTEERFALVLDAAQLNRVRYFEIPDAGYVMEPDTLYLGVTAEYTESHKHVPFLEGKSSCGRLGLSVHATAGKGDVGFANHWTLEMTVVHPLRVYAGMPVAQLIFFVVAGEVLVPYDQKPSANYTERDPRPQPSRLWRSFK
jgi:dCTP deaminase